MQQVGQGANMQDTRQHFGVLLWVFCWLGVTLFVCSRKLDLLNDSSVLELQLLPNWKYNYTTTFSILEGFH